MTGTAASASALARRPPASFCTIGEMVAKPTTPTTAAIAERARTRLSSLATWRPFTLDWAEFARPAAEHYGALTKARTLTQRPAANRRPRPRNSPWGAICHARRSVAAPLCQILHHGH